MIAIVIAEVIAAIIAIVAIVRHKANSLALSMALLAITEAPLFHLALFVGWMHPLHNNMTESTSRILSMLAAVSGPLGYLMLPCCEKYRPMTIDVWGIFFLTTAVPSVYGMIRMFRTDGRKGAFCLLFGVFMWLFWGFCWLCAYR